MKKNGSTLLTDDLSYQRKKKQTLTSNSKLSSQRGELWPVEVTEKELLLQHHPRIPRGDSARYVDPWDN